MLKQTSQDQKDGGKSLSEIEHDSFQEHLCNTEKQATATETETDKQIKYLNNKCIVTKGRVPRNSHLCREKVRHTVRHAQIFSLLKRNWQNAKIIQMKLRKQFQKQLWPYIRQTPQRLWQLSIERDIACCHDDT